MVQYSSSFCISDSLMWLHLWLLLGLVNDFCKYFSCSSHMLFLEKIILNHPQLTFRDTGVLKISYLGVRLKPIPPKQESFGYDTETHIWPWLFCLPYSHQIKLQDHYGNSMKNRKVNLIIKFMRRQLIKTYITDSTGRASFNLDTTAWNTSSVSLEVNSTFVYKKVINLVLF